jgi:hypothetical protein
MQKAMTLRLIEAKAKELETVARIDGMSVSEAVRSAIDAHIEARRQDHAFQERLQRALAEERETLERLAQ